MKALTSDEVAILKKSLPVKFQGFIESDEAWLQVYPLLFLVCTDRDVLRKLRDAFDIPVPQLLDAKDLQAAASSLLDVLNQKAICCRLNPTFIYRLPQVMSEYPIHNRAINQAIQQFNAHVSLFHEEKCFETQAVENAFRSLLKALKIHAPFCEANSLWQLLTAMSGWVEGEVSALYEAYPYLLYPQKECVKAHEAAEIKVEMVAEVKPEVAESKQLNRQASGNPFVANYNYNFNRAGRLAKETDTLLLNAFGMKIGGHLDAQVKYPPRMIPIDQLHIIIQRQLSHRMEVQRSVQFDILMEHTLANLGVSITDGHVNPFLEKPISFLSPEKILSVLKKNLQFLTADEKSETPLNEFELKIIANYLIELLQGFQVNPGLALGIGANWDGTVNLSNESGAYSFKFSENESEWGALFRQLSMHRQGPAEAYMNAGKGFEYEVISLLTDFEYMSQLQPSEHAELIYNALIDNMVAELFPEPAYFENAQYQKFRQQYVVTEREQGEQIIESYYEPSDSGTYFQDKKGVFKQTPLHRKAGTLEVQPFPRNTGYSENSRASYAGNPLAALQLQYMQSLYGCTRGHVVYNPIGEDHFIPDAFYGQVMRSEQGDLVPFIGVMPKNFDKHFKQSVELCASFVIRMLQSSRIMTYCPTFRETLQLILAGFLPNHEALPPLPEFINNRHVGELHQALQQALQTQAGYEVTNHDYFSLFKNLIYGLYAFGKQDENFKNCYSTIMLSKDFISKPSRAKCEELVRILIVNKPQVGIADHLEKFEKVIAYLKALITFYYPQPKDEIAKDIARDARAHVRLLLSSEPIQQYFVEMQQWQQANLSRQQTPGMAYAALKHGGPSKTALHDYQEMHGKNFESGYRDPEGNQIGSPERYERFIDWLSKKLGLSLQLMQKYHLFAVIRRPFSETVIQIKEASHRYPRSSWRLLVAGLRGFVWEGLVKGLGQTVITPFRMIFDIALLAVENANATKNNSLNPLAFSAAPINTPGLRVKTAIEVRDAILKLMSGSNRKKSFRYGKVFLFEKSSQLLSELYKPLSDDAIDLCRIRLAQTFPLTEVDWREFLFAFRVDFKTTKVAAIFDAHYISINKDLCYALFKCFTHPDFHLSQDKVVKEVQSFYRLTDVQMKAFKAFLNFYQKLERADERQSFIQLFKFDGKVMEILQMRDQYLQKLQKWITIVFSERWVKETVFEGQVEKLNGSLSQDNLVEISKSLPDSIKGALLESLRLNQMRCLDYYDFPENQKTFIKHFHREFYKITDQFLKAAILKFLSESPKIQSNGIQSEKDKAQHKWTQFAERELSHRLLSENDANAIFELLTKSFKTNPGLTFHLVSLKDAYIRFSAQQEFKACPLQGFYDAVIAMIAALNQYKLQFSKLAMRECEEVITVVRNFMDVTMNAVINARLDAVDIFKAESELPNPLLVSPAIESWLRELHDNPSDLRALLEQQVQQSPSLDHAVWRNQCILQVLERNRPEQKIPKTGMQSLLRLWSQHKENVTRLGEVYVDPKTNLQTKVYSTALLFNQSRTMQHALERVQYKLPQPLRK